MKKKVIGLKVKKQEATALHERAVKLRKAVETDSWQLGEVLKEIKDKKLYKHLDCTSFVEYTEKHLNFSRKKAYMCISMHELSPLTTEMIIDLGISKVYEIFLVKKKLSGKLRQTFAEKALHLSYNDCCSVRKAIKKTPDKAEVILSDPSAFLKEMKESENNGKSPAKTFISRTGTFSQKLSELQSLMQSDNDCLSEEESKDLLKSLAEAEKKIREVIDELNVEKQAA